MKKNLKSVDTQRLDKNRVSKNTEKTLLSASYYVKEIKKLNEVDKMILDEKKEQIEELQNKIAKAIEYIESHNFYALEDEEFRQVNEKKNAEYIISLNKEPILKILKGDVK